ncbi:hypothetical protein [Plantactinospora sp. B5E13]
MTDDETSQRPGRRAMGILRFVARCLLSGTAGAVVGWLLDRVLRG